MSREENKNKILLHSCCGPCSCSVIERLLNLYDVTVFFYNPNISTSHEYDKRLEAQIQVIKWFEENSGTGVNIDLLEGEYDKQLFQRMTAGREEDREGGARCDLCFELRLNQTAKLAQERGFDMFTTTLSVSPHKNYESICRIGTGLEKIYGISFLEECFRKKNGFTRGVEISKEIGIYRQRFCGCEYSIW